MESTYISFKDAIDKLKKESPVEKKLGERASLFKELYSYYEISYKKNTWIDYINWLKNNKYKHSLLKVEEYRKIAHKKISIQSFCSFWFSFMPTNDIYYLISIVKDMDKRNQNVNKWLFWSIKVQNTTTQNN